MAWRRRAGQCALQALQRSQLGGGGAGAGAAAGARGYGTSSSHGAEGGLPLAWVFLGPPGVGKGTYATRVADTLGMTHISAGDLVRAEVKSGSPLGRRMAAVVDAGELLPDALVLDVLRRRFAEGPARDGVAGPAGAERFLLDGFPRTVPQAAALAGVADVALALNLHLRHDVLVAKCLGRRLCSKCGKNYNVADIDVAAAGPGAPAIRMPPLAPPPECEGYMEQRSDDNEATILRRIDVYRAGAAPVEEFYRARGALVEFDIAGGIPETLPRLLATLEPHAAAAAAHAAGGGQAAAPRAETA